MNKHLNRLIIILSIGIIFCVHAQSDLSNSNNGYGQIYIFRSTGMQGSPWKFKILLETNVICKLGNKKYSFHEIKAGVHLFSAKFYGKKETLGSKPLLIDVKAGGTYYIKLVIEEIVSIISKSELNCVQITEKESDLLFNSLKEEDKCY